MISAGFCDELIKISMTEESKEKAKAIGKIVGGGAASAGAAHGLYTLGRYAVEKSLDRPLRSAVARKYAPIAAPVIGAIGGGLATANLLAKRNILEEAAAKGRARDEAKRGAS
jgi:hypothetical protein